YPVDLGIGLGPDQRGVCFLDAHVLGIARKIVTFFLGHTVRRLGTRHARILTRLRRGLVSGFRIGLGDLFLAVGFRQADVLRVAAARRAGFLVRLVLRLGVLDRHIVSILRYRRRGGHRSRSGRWRGRL